MKRLIFSLILTAFCFAIPSCGDDDPDEISVESYSKSIVGEWSYIDSEDGEEYRMVFSADGSCHEKYLENGAFVDDSWVEKWTVNGSKLIISDSDKNHQEVYTIVKITSKELVLEEYDGELWTLTRI